MNGLVVVMSATVWSVMYQLPSMGRSAVMRWSRTSLLERTFTRSSFGTVLLTRSSEHDFWDWPHVGAVVEPSTQVEVSHFQVVTL
jgi:hypothetical protein